MLIIFIQKTTYPKNKTLFNISPIKTDTELRRIVQLS